LDDFITKYVILGYVMADYVRLRQIRSG